MVGIITPIALALLAVAVRQIFKSGLPEGSELEAVALRDRDRLGSRRYSPLRVWFAMLVAKMEDARGLRASIGGPDALVDLTLPSHLGPVGGQSGSWVDALDSMAAEEAQDRAEMAWLQTSLESVRAQLSAEETATESEFALAMCWIGRGKLRSWGFGPASHHRASMTLCNASDLGRQGFIEFDWVGGPLIGVEVCQLAGIFHGQDFFSTVSDVTVTLDRSLFDKDPAQQPRGLLREALGTPYLMRTWSADRLVSVLHRNHQDLRARDLAERVAVSAPVRAMTSRIRPRLVRSVTVGHVGGDSLPKCFRYRDWENHTAPGSSSATSPSG